MEITPLMPDRPDSVVYGKVYLSSEHAELGRKFTPHLLRKRNLPHQAVFDQRSVFDIVGMFSLDYPILADYALNIRCFGNPGIATFYIDKVMANFEARTARRPAEASAPARPEGDPSGGAAAARLGKPPRRPRRRRNGFAVSATSHRPTWKGRWLLSCKSWRPTVRARRIELPGGREPSRWVAAEEEALYRQAFGLDAADPEQARAAGTMILGRFLATHALVGLRDVLDRYPFERELAQRLLEEWARSGRATAVPAADEGPLRWSAPENLEQVQRGSLALLRARGCRLSAAAVRRLPAALAERSPDRTGRPGGEPCGRSGPPAGLIIARRVVGADDTAGPRS